VRGKAQHTQVITHKTREDGTGAEPSGAKGREGSGAVEVIQCSSMVAVGLIDNMDSVAA